MKKILSAILVLLFIAACFVSCAEKEPVQDGSGTKKAELTTVEIANETEPEETKEPTKAEIAQTFLDKIPNVNYNREFNVLCMQGVGNSEKEVWVENASDEPIDNAVYMRNTALYDKLGVTIVKHPVDVGTIFSEVQKDIKGNAHDYDLIMSNGNGTGTLAQSGYLYNYLDLADYINLDQEWWDPGTVRDCEINGKVFFMNGDINILDNDVTWILLFNKKLIKDYDLPEPYDLVTKGEWTLDRFYEMVSSEVSHPNSNNEYDENAYYGFITTNGGGLTNFLYTCDMTTVKVTNGEPEIIIGDAKNVEKVTKILEWCKKTISDTHLTWFSVNNPAQTKEMFMTNHSLFYSEVMSYIVNLADMEYDFGVLPTPKYDADQKEYRTHVDNVGSMISIPSNLPDEKKEEVGYIIETLALYSYMYVTPAYYDVTLKRKKSRDADSQDMIDIILKSRVYDVGYIYSSIGLAEMFKQLVTNGSTSFGSSYEKNKTKAAKALKKIVDKYNKL